MQLQTDDVQTFGACRGKLTLVIKPLSDGNIWAWLYFYFLTLLMYFLRLVDVCEKQRGHFGRSRNKSCNKEILVLMPSRTSDTKVPLSFSSFNWAIHIVQIFLYNHIHFVLQNRIGVTSYEAKHSVTLSALYHNWTLSRRDNFLKCIIDCERSSLESTMTMNATNACRSLPPKLRIVHS